MILPNSIHGEPRHDGIRGIGQPLGKPTAATAGGGLGRRDAVRLRLATQASGTPGSTSEPAAR